MSPIYSYRCKRCEFEIIDKFMFKDIKEMKCPNCNSTAIRIPTFANFVINGYSSRNNYMGDAKYDKNKR